MVLVIKDYLYRVRNRYDFVAPFYDGLSRLIFGNAIRYAQRAYILNIPQGCKWLVVGGGTGEILENITDTNPSSITFVEASQKMIYRAKKRNVNQTSINFVHAYVEDVVFDETFDVIVSPFFFDNFSQSEADLLFSQLNQILIKDGFWLQVDFTEKATGWQALLLKMMYVFFAVFSKVKTKKMPHIEALFYKEYTLMERSGFYGGFILSSLYKKKIS